MEKKTIKILIANDHSILRSGIRILFNKDERIQVVGEAGNFKELLEKLTQIPADLLMTDDVMPFGDILTVLPVIKEQYPELKIIVNSMHDVSAPHINKMMEWADALIGFNSAEADFIKVVETVCGINNFSKRKYS